MASRFPFRLGAPSYVYPADIVPNVVRLGPHVDDVELLLFEVRSPRDLPGELTIAELSALAEEHALTYTVHLPLDLELASPDARLRDASLRVAQEVIGATRKLDPWAYVVHVGGAEDALSVSPAALDAWRDRAGRSLEALAKEVENPESLAVENLTDTAPPVVASLLERVPVSLCFDVGHALKTGEDPLPFLRKHLDRIRVVHLHAAADGRDHLGLEQIDGSLLISLIDGFTAEAFRGVVTVEVFAEAPFFESVEVLRGHVKGRW